VVEAVGSIPALRQALELVRPGGTILAFGTQTATQAELPLYDLYYKEVTVASTRASCPADMDTALSLVSRGQVDLATLVSDRLTLAEAPEAIARARACAVKVVMTHT
jgi:threonine dehydrogenase-like Zn-dependent dehydrogenase